MKFVFFVTTMPAVVPALVDIILEQTKTIKQLKRKLEDMQRELDDMKDDIASIRDLADDAMATAEGVTDDIAKAVKSTESLDAEVARLENRVADLESDNCCEHCSNKVY